MNTILQQLFKLLLTDSAKGKARNGNRTFQSFALCVLLLWAYRMDKRQTVVEARLGITNAPVNISLPFTLAPSNAPSLNLVKDFNR